MIVCRATAATTEWKFPQLSGNTTQTRLPLVYHLQQWLRNSSACRSAPSYCEPSVADRNKKHDCTDFETNLQWLIWQRPLALEKPLRLSRCPAFAKHCRKCCSFIGHPAKSPIFRNVQSTAMMRHYCGHCKVPPKECSEVRKPGGADHPPLAWPCFLHTSCQARGRSPTPWFPCLRALFGACSGAATAGQSNLVPLRENHVCFEPLLWV